MPRTRLEPRERILAGLAYVFLGVPGALLFGIGSILFFWTCIFILVSGEKPSVDEAAVPAGIGLACLLIGYLMYTCTSIVAKEPQYRIPAKRLLPLLAFDLLHLLVAIASASLCVVVLFSFASAEPGKAPGILLCSAFALTFGCVTFVGVRKRKHLLRKWKAEMVDLPQPWAESPPGVNPR